MPDRFKLTIVQFEPEWLDQVQDGARRRADARNIARVRRDFRFNQDNVHRLPSRMRAFGPDAILNLRAEGPIYACSKPSTAPTRARAPSSRPRAGHAA
jgi:hypothetical protein